MEAVRTSETSVDNHFTRQYNPEDSSEHHTRRRENLKSHVKVMLTESTAVMKYCCFTVVTAVLQLRRRLFTADDRVSAQGSPHGICSKYSVTGTCFSSNVSAFPCIISSLPYIHSHYRTMGPSTTQFHRHMVSTHRNNKNLKLISYT
jgi:hypothetical protein